MAEIAYAEETIMNEFERNQQEPKMETLGLICTKETFRPYTLDLLAPSDKDNTIVRWLDQDEDFLMAKDFWTIPLSRQDWIEFHEAGYRYCAVIKAHKNQNRGDSRDAGDWPIVWMPITID